MSESSSPEDLRAREVLDEVLAVVPTAILIGGWASWARTGGAMSHDIDLIVGYPEMDEIREHVADLSQSRHVGGVKWRGSWDGIHLDLYLPHQSMLGALLRLRVEQLASHTDTIDGRRLLSVGAHIATKWAAMLDRPDSERGDKDRAELLKLLKQPGAAAAADVMREASLLTPEAVDAAIHRGFELLAEAPGVSRSDRQALRRMSIAWTTPTAGRPYDPSLGIGRDGIER